MKIESFTDFDKFSEENAGIDARFLIRDTGRRLWKTETLRAGDCILQRAHSGSGLVAEGVGSKDFYTFNVPLMDGRLISSGKAMTDDAISINVPGAEFFATIPKQASWQVFAVPRNLIEEKMGIARPKASFRYRVGNQKRRADRVRTVFEEALATVSKDPIIEGTPAMTALADDLKSLLISLLELKPGQDADHSDVIYPDIVKTEVLYRTRAFLEAHSSEAVHVSDLASAAEVSERTLRRVFRDFYGVGPRTFVFLRQLMKVHQELIEATPAETTVTDVLMHWGIWEFGRFAGRYKQYFGELPSQTLLRPPIDY